MRPLLWLFLTLSRLFGCRILAMTVDGRGAYDHIRIATGGELDKATDGLVFKWKGCRVGYEQSPEDIVNGWADGINCQWCGKKWEHSLTRIDSKGREVPARNPGERCERCARKVAERRGVPWETVR